MLCLCSCQMRQGDLNIHNIVQTQNERNSCVGKDELSAANQLSRVKVIQAVLTSGNAIQWVLVLVVFTESQFLVPLKPSWDEPAKGSFTMQNIKGMKMAFRTSGFGGFPPKILLCYTSHNEHNSATKHGHLDYAAGHRLPSLLLENFRNEHNITVLLRKGGEKGSISAIKMSISGLFKKY